MRDPLKGWARKDGALAGTFGFQYAPVGGAGCGLEGFEESSQAGKGLTGLDEHQVRRWTSWHRWVTLAMLAAAVLTIAAAAEHGCGPGPAGPIPLTRNEIARLLATIAISPARDAEHRMRWSRWRRRHQYRSRACHYQRQAAEGP